MPQPPQPSDADLVRASLDGQAEAYRELVSRYQGHVYGLAYSVLGDWSEAQDVAQETFIRVHLNLDRLRDPARFAPWLRRVSFSVTMNWLRAFKPRVFEQLDGRLDLETLELPDFQPGPSEVVERRELADAVLRAVDALPPKYRVPLTMFHLDGLSYQKVAAFLDIPLGTAKSLIHRARQKLKPALEAYVTEEIAPMVREVFDEHRLPDDFAHRLIGGLERERWGSGTRENSTIGAFAAALRALDRDASYEFLMGVSGAAFRLHMHKPEWCESGPHVRCGFDCLTTLMDALPFELVDMPVDRDDASAVAELREAIVESIDLGRPVFYSSMEESLIVGYRDGGKRLLLRLYGATEEGYAPWSLERQNGQDGEEYPASFVTDWPHLSFGFLEPCDPPDRRASILRSLELAVELAHTPQFALYTSGFAAYEFWRDGLRDEARFEDGARNRRQMGANGHCYSSLCDARAAAATYLRQVAGELGGACGAHVSRAAELYRQIAEDVLTAREPHEIAPMPWTLGPDRAWTREMRLAQAELLDRALALERRAVAELEKALAAGA